MNVLHMVHKPLQVQVQEQMQGHSQLEQPQTSHSGQTLQPQEMRQTHSTQVRFLLSQVAPLWTSVLAQLSKSDRVCFLVKGKRLDISRCNACVVGEAHGFDKDYSGCDECYQSSIEFATLLRMAPKARLEPLTKFVNHFNKEHAKYR